MSRMVITLLTMAFRASTVFPLGPSASQNTFVTKHDAQGRLVYSTVLTGYYHCRAIAVDHSGKIECNRK